MEVSPGSPRTPVSLLLSLLSCLGRPGVPPDYPLRSPPLHFHHSRQYVHRHPISLPGAWKQYSSSWRQAPHQLTSALLQGPVLLQLDPSELPLPPFSWHASEPYFSSQTQRGIPRFVQLACWSQSPDSSTFDPCVKTWFSRFCTLLTQSERLSVDTPRRYMRESSSLAAILHARSG